MDIKDRLDNAAATGEELQARDADALKEEPVGIEDTLKLDNIDTADVELLDKNHDALNEAAIEEGVDDDECLEEDMLFVKAYMDTDGIKAPESLSRGSILSMIESADAAKTHNAVAGEVEPVESEIGGLERNVLLAEGDSKEGCAAKSDCRDKAVSKGTDSDGRGAGNVRKGWRSVFTSTRGRKRFMQVAACLLAVVIAIPAFDSVVPREVKTDETGLRVFQDKREIKKLVRELVDEDEEGKVYVTGRDGADGIAMVEESNDIGADSVKKSATANGDFSETYKQVEGVDEADIIKTDGKYIYLVTAESDIAIWRADKGEAEKISAISGFEEDKYITDIFLTGDKLVAVGYDCSSDNTKSFANIYDISDAENPEKLAVHEQSGSIRASRLTGGKLYMVTNCYPDRDRYMPYVTIDGKYTAMEIEDICSVPNPTEAGYLVLTSIDLKSGKEFKSKSKAIFGAGENIYCNTEHLYIANTEFRIIEGESETTTHAETMIIRASLNDGNVKFDGTGKVRGYVNDRFAMDEKDGYLRVATTSYRNDKNVNNLYVLDENLEKVGEVTGFARDEHIEAVKYIGDKGYVITFEQTDPLFIIDLSDPKEPKIEGEVKIDGFSTMLVPVDEDKLLGVGYSTAENFYGGVYTNGVKISLFDISNSAEPKVLDSAEFEGYSSEAQTDPHALLQNHSKGYYAVPYYYNSDEDSNFGVDAEVAEESDEGDVPFEYGDSRGGVLVFTADGAIDVIDNHVVNKTGVIRCVYIGGYIYTTDNYDEVVGFKLK